MRVEVGVCVRALKWVSGLRGCLRAFAFAFT